MDYCLFISLEFLFKFFFYKYEQNWKLIYNCIKFHFLCNLYWIFWAWNENINVLILLPHTSTAVLSTKTKHKQTKGILGYIKENYLPLCFRTPFPVCLSVEVWNFLLAYVSNLIKQNFHDNKRETFFATNI